MPAARAVCGIVLKDQKLLQGFGESKPCEVDHGFVREAKVHKFAGCACWS